MQAKRSYRLDYNGAILLTTSLQGHRNNVRIVSAMKYSKRHGFESARMKFKYKTIDSMKKSARKKLGKNYPFELKKAITDEMVREGLIMRETMTVKATADHFGVSQSHFGKKMMEAKQNSNCDRMFQKVLCNKLI